MNNIFSSLNMLNGTFYTYILKPELSFRMVTQKHTNIIVDAQNSTNDTIADGIVDFTKKLNLCTITADCVPIAIEGKNGNAVIHAGWRGLHLKILEHPLLKEIEPLYAAIAPCISLKNYEVGPEFQDYFVNRSSLVLKSNQLYFGVLEEAKLQLVELFPKIEINASNFCTFDSLKIHSYRRTKEKGRNWNIYQPNNN